MQGPKIWNPSRPLPMAAAFILQSIGLIGFSQLVPKLQIPIAIRQPNTLTAGGNGEGTELHTVAKVQEPVGPSAVGSIQARCPMDFTPKDVPADGVYGVKRVTRHSTFWALGLLGAGTALGTPFASEIVMFGMPAVFAVIGGAHQDYRHRCALAAHVCVFVRQPDHVGRQDGGKLLLACEPLRRYLLSVVVCLTDADQGASCQPT